MSNDIKYLLKQKSFCLGNDFQIFDENRSPVFQIDGKAFNWGNNLSFQDMSGKELAHISQSMSLFQPKYQIEIDGQLFAEVVKEFSWFNKKFTLDVPGPNDYEIDGDFWKHEYRFMRSGRMVAEVTKKHFSWTDTYGVEIIGGEDIVSILSTVIVIDLVCHEDND